MTQPLNEPTDLEKANADGYAAGIARGRADAALAVRRAVPADHNVQNVDWDALDRIAREGR